MKDLIIQELFPSQQSIMIEHSFSSHDCNSFELLKAFDDNHKLWKRHNLDYLKADFDLSHTHTHYMQSFFPSTFSRKALLYLQLICSGTFSSKHYTIRKDLPSYLIAHTFWGKGILRYEGREYELNPNDLFFIDCRKKHEYFAVSPKGWGYRFIHFDGYSMAEYYKKILESENICFTFPNDSHLYRLFKDLILINHESDPNNEIISNRILTDMITEIFCQLPQYKESNSPKFIAELCDYLQNSFTKKLSLDDIAAECNLSKYYMCREFKKYTGKTIFNYITDLRISLAQRLLRYSNLSINEIAENIGFEDHNGFYRTFMQREEMSPSTYRKYWKTF
ncbi:helix-turn-helix transcriptional regulator [Mediterraneibacter gnavus]|uniref:helix-turn-helix transcriptional regulator n=1 Tax=Mediterraneibacter gnavus TaxID=33038 RepID=UPI00232BBF4E|nr:AraC family transcriptional regulator [Mediterraneibacter gnavus]MDB8711362.1 AraC family transcriptional regulator [Mediterraneibacter gnavus]MDB8714471.1 AraC family transcriptional regulator [Mediterraneibacter gnavus]